MFIGLEHWGITSFLFVYCTGFYTHGPMCLSKYINTECMQIGFKISVFSAFRVALPAIVCDFSSSEGNFLPMAPWLAPIVREGTFDPTLIDAIYKKKNITIATAVFALGKWVPFFQHSLFSRCRLVYLRHSSPKMLGSQLCTCFIYLFKIFVLLMPIILCPSGLHLK